MIIIKSHFITDTYCKCFNIINLKILSSTYVISSFISLHIQTIILYYEISQLYHIIILTYYYFISYFHLLLGY